ncbi:hypothetical protein NE237_012878 [Protea cynaroides]|uniref:Amidase domain-containing protein n=1 Tax=Protea cynaroides TaxID=273540 RepID=A0A9Q0H0Y9_9MAGN|nr:hypothetical protein NE237_012878 [Protea cynaroides]
MAEVKSDYGAFIEKFVLHPPPTASPQQLPLNGLTFAIKDIFDIEGYVTGFGNPDWARSHSPAVSTAPVVLALLNAGATSIGKTILDEMACSIQGENIHYGTPVNPCAPDRIPGGSSSGSAVAVAAKLVDFSLGTDTGGSVRAPAAFCGIYGIRPSHAVVPTSGVTPLAQSFDTVGWFARDPVILNQVGRVLLQLPNVEPVQPSHIVIPDDCFQLLSIPSDRVTQVLLKSVEKLFGGQIVRHTNLGDYVKDKVPSLKHFMGEGNDKLENNIPSLMALSRAMRVLQRYELKINHEEWISSVKPDLESGISGRVQDAIKTTSENIDIFHMVRNEFRAALTDLVEEFGILAIPTVPDPPVKLQTETVALENFRTRAASLLCIAGVSGFCQVTIPLGMYENLPVAVSLLAKHGADVTLCTIQEMNVNFLNVHLNKHEGSYKALVSDAAKCFLMEGTEHYASEVELSIAAVFGLGIDTGGSVRAPAAFCGIYGIRPSHAVVPTSGVTPLAQSFDIVGWFARDPVILNQVGRVLLQLPNVEPVQPSHIIIPDDCFQLLSIPSDRVTEVLLKSCLEAKLLGIQTLVIMLKDIVPSLKHFMGEGNDQLENNIPSLMALTRAMRVLQRYELKINHEEWISSVKPDLESGVSGRIQEALKSTSENIDIFHMVRNEFYAALTDLVERLLLLKISVLEQPACCVSLEFLDFAR